MIPLPRCAPVRGQQHATPRGPALAVVPDDAARLAMYRSPAFRREHPDVVILLCGALPKAWVGSEQYTRCSLRSLLDKLDELFAGG